MALLPDSKLPVGPEKQSREQPPWAPSTLGTRDRCLRRWGQMDVERSSWLTHWRDLAEVLGPTEARFFVTDRNRGGKRYGSIMNSSPLLAARALTSGMMGGLTNPSRPWFLIRTMDDDLMQNAEVKRWCDDVRRRMMSVFLRSNLYTVLPVVFSDLGKFATSCLAVEEDRRDVVRFQHYPLGSYCIANGPRGLVNTFYRRFQQTVGFLYQRFGYENLPAVVQRLCAQRQFDAWVEVMHAIEPNEGLGNLRPEARSKPFVSTYLVTGGGSSTLGGQQSTPIPDSEAVISQRGFEEFPIVAPRWQVFGEDTYGSDCPGMMALGDVRQLMLEERRKAQALEKIITPPMVAPASMRTQRISMLAGDITYLDDDALRKAHKVESMYAVPPQVLDIVNDIAKLEQRIDQAFHKDLFLMLDNLETKQPITAAEVAERKEEKLLQLGPVMNRLNDELLDPLIKRTFGIMLRAGEIPPPPPQLQGSVLTVEYESILAQAVKLTQVAAIERFTSWTGGLVAVDPGVMDNVNLDEAVQAYGDALGVPPAVVNDPEDVAKERASKEQQARIQSMIQNAQGASQVAQTLSQTPTTTPSALTALSQGLRGANG